MINSHKFNPPKCGCKLNPQDIGKKVTLTNWFIKRKVKVLALYVEEIEALKAKITMLLQDHVMSAAIPFKTSHQISG